MRTCQSNSTWDGTAAVCSGEYSELQDFVISSVYANRPLALSVYYNALGWTQIQRKYDVVS